ncbi:beta-galactosidase, partial [Kitasatospora sp. NPDC054939]
MGCGGWRWSAGPVLGNLLRPTYAEAAGTPGYHLDTAATELRPDTALPGFGGTGGGVTYGVTYNGWSRNGQAWYPLSGEFHYVRYPAHRWERELGKMRAAGLDTVATYAFWNHHENPQGTWDWTGNRDLRAFLAAAQRQGLLVWLRVGPYINAETNDGGIPSFALSGKRTDDPGYLAKVGSYFSQLADQLQGQFVKDSGPIVGIQLENEASHRALCLALVVRRIREPDPGQARQAAVQVRSRMAKAASALRAPVGACADAARMRRHASGDDGRPDAGRRPAATSTSPCTSRPMPIRSMGTGTTRRKRGRPCKGESVGEPRGQAGCPASMSATSPRRSGPR